MRATRILPAACTAACVVLASHAPRAEAQTPAPAPIPPAFEVYEATIGAMQTAMAAGRVTSQGLVAQYLSRIAAYDTTGPSLRSLIRLNPDALRDAAALDSERVARGPRGPLHGIPVVVKDNYDTRDLPTTAGSVSLAGLVPARDAVVVAHLRDAGAVILGKTNMMEFALGVYTASSIGGVTRNPYDPSRSPGGSSGGTAAAVAASLAAVGWGTDTCGSLRVPAAYNALFALRPTKGITSTRGIVPLCHSQDVAGAMARTVADLAIALDATVAIDSADAASARWARRPLPRFVPALDSAALRGARLGVLKQYFGTGPSEVEVSDTVRAALTRMRAAGAVLVDVSIPEIDSLAPSGNVVAFEFRDDLAGYLAGRANAPVRSLSDILSRGLYLSQLRDDYRALASSPDTASAAYRRAVANRARLERRLLAVLAGKRLDALVYPTVRTGPHLAGEPQTDPNCEAAGSSGFPALSVPVGFTQDGLPVGMELLGAPLHDARLVAMGYAWERLAHPRVPPLYTPPLEAKFAPKPSKVDVVITSDSLTAEAVLTFDAPTGRLGYTLSVTGIASGDLLAASLHQASATDSVGPVIAVLAAPGRLTSAGVLTLPFPTRVALHAGRLYITVLTKQHPLGTLRGRVPAPRGPHVVPNPPHVDERSPR